MTTPKTDIEQTVGRILREKHSEPIVVDIIDHHDPFQKQWKKRKTFYMKENYKILHIKDRDYLNSTIESRPWTTVFNPKEKKTKEKEKEVLNEGRDDVQDLKGTCFLKIKK
jgi:predicted secreted protein